MTTIYLLMGAVGSTLLIVQFLLTVLGFGHHDFDTGGLSADGADTIDVSHDVDVHGGADDLNVDHAGGSLFFRMLSARAMVSAVTFFGWSGLAATSSGLTELRAFSVAFGAGLLAMYLVAWMLHTLTRLHAEGNVQITQAIGATGTVYLSIPGNREGIGKVHVNVQQRTMEYNAVTSDTRLPTGMPIVVVGIADGETLEVRPAPRMEVVE